MAEPQRRALAQVRLDLSVERTVDLVGRKHHRDVGRADGVLEQSNLEPGRFGLGCAAGSAAEAHDHVDPAVVQVERLRAALVAVTDDRHALAGQRGGVDVGVAQHLQFRSP